MSNRVEHQKLNQVAEELPPGLVFGVQLGLRQTQALIKIKTIRWGTLLLLILLVLIGACVCRRPSWTPKTQPGGSSAVTWLSFWCSTRLLMSIKKCISYRRKTCRREGLVTQIDAAHLKDPSTRGIMQTSVKLGADREVHLGCLSVCAGNESAAS